MKPAIEVRAQARCIVRAARDILLGDRPQPLMARMAALEAVEWATEARVDESADLVGWAAGCLWLAREAAR